MYRFTVRIAKLSLFLFIFSGVSSCHPAQNTLLSVNMLWTLWFTALQAVSEPQSEITPLSLSPPETPAKNIILMIGDGMGYAQLEATRRFYHPQTPLSIETLPHHGKVNTASLSEMLARARHTDSAAAATAMATGVSVCNGVISKPCQHSCDVGESDAPSIVEMFKTQGMSTGIVTSVAVTHATPAAFASHAEHRNNVENIIDGLFEVRPNIVMGASTYKHHAIPRQKAIQQGYKVVDTKTQLDALTKVMSPDQYLLGLFDSEKNPASLPREHSAREEFARRDLPHLKDMALSAIKILEQNQSGYFLMIEGGMIDWGGHENDIKTVIAETKAFDDTVAAIHQHIAASEDTLLIVTADHETGGLSIQPGTRADGYPNHQWKWTKHTNALIPVYAWGKDTEILHEKTIRNTDLFHFMVNASGIEFSAEKLAGKESNQDTES